MEVTNELVPYIVKRFKIMALKESNARVTVAYVEKPNKQEIEELERFLEKKVVFKTQVDEDEFWPIAQEIYPEVAFDIPEKKAVVKEEAKPAPKRRQRRKPAEKVIEVVEETVEDPVEEPVEDPVEDPVVVEEEPKQPVSPEEPVQLDLTNVSTEALLKEIRDRQLKTDAEAIITINPDRTIGFEFTRLGWPNGRFKTNMTIIEELPLLEPKPQENAPKKAE